MEPLIAFGDIALAGNALWRWLLAFAFAAALVCLMLRARHHAAARYAALRRTEAIELLEIPYRVAERTAMFFVIAIAGGAGLATLDLTDGQRAILADAVLVATLWQGGLWGSAGLGAWLERRRQRLLADNRAAAGSLDIIGFVSRLALWAVVALLTLDNLGVDITALIAGLGIGGIAIALAVQNILGDLFASLSITFDKPFVVGDFLIVGEFMGTVENIGIKSTRLRSLTGEQIVIANADLLASRVRNYQRMQERRVVFTLGVIYATQRATLEKIPALVRDAVECQPEVRFDRCHFARYGAYSLDFETVYYVTTPDYNRHMDVQQAILFGIHAAFERAGIEFAFPTQTLHLSSGDTILNCP
jgi:small-conductance mechanosensitive channel